MFRDWTRWKVRQAPEFATAPAAPANVVLPFITGVASVGELLTANAGTWTGHPAPTYSYTWLADGASFDSGSSITLTAARAGKVITLRVTATNASGSVQATSAGTSAVTYAPTNTTAPSVSGTTQVGQTLTAAAGVWAGYPTPTVARQWQRDGANIDGATASTYVLVSADVGAMIRVRETATNSVSSVSANSTAVGTVTSPSTAPAAPTNAQVSAITASSVTLSWTDNSNNETGFRVERVVPAWSLGHPGVDCAAASLVNQAARESSLLANRTGFAAGATGGAGGAMVTVTNTNASGAGSLAEALIATDPRWIIFDPALSGQTITMPGDLWHNGNKTIDGRGCANLTIRLNGDGGFKANAKNLICAYVKLAGNTAYSATNVAYFSRIGGTYWFYHVDVESTGDEGISFDNAFAASEGVDATVSFSRFLSQGKGIYMAGKNEPATRITRLTVHDNDLQADQRCPLMHRSFGHIYNNRIRFRYAGVEVNDQSYAIVERNIIDLISGGSGHRPQDGVLTYANPTGEGWPASTGKAWLSGNWFLSSTYTTEYAGDGIDPASPAQPAIPYTYTLDTDQSAILARIAAWSGNRQDVAPPSGGSGSAVTLSGSTNPTSANVTSVTVTGLSAGSHRLRVRAENATGNSDWAETVDFVVPAGNTYGSNLVTNGDGSSTSGWDALGAAAGGLSLVGGRLRITLGSSPAWNATAQQLSLTSGTSYRVEGVQKALASNATPKSARILLYRRDAEVNYVDHVIETAANGSDSSIDMTWTPSGSGTFWMSLDVASADYYGVSGEAAEWDNLSVREIL